MDVEQFSFLIHIVLEMFPREKSANVSRLRFTSHEECWEFWVEEDASKVRISFRNYNMQIFKYTDQMKIVGNYQERSSSWPPHDQQESLVIETTLNRWSSQLPTWIGPGIETERIFLSLPGLHSGVADRHGCLVSHFVLIQTKLP